MGEKRARRLVLDTSVALKFYLPEEGHEEAVRLLEAAEASEAELLATGTILPEGFNAIAQQGAAGSMRRTRQARGRSCSGRRSTPTQWRTS